MSGLLRFAWALPCSSLGALLGGLLCLALGGSARFVAGCVEIALRDRQSDVPPWGRRVPFLAITFGHVIVGQSHDGMAALRTHEHVHVRQYERWGLFFLVAYPIASLVAGVQGKCPYRGNVFEREAFRASQCPRAA